MEDGQTMQGWSTAVTNRWRESIETYIDKAFEGIAEMVEGGQSRVGVTRGGTVETKDMTGWVFGDKDGVSVSKDSDVIPPMPEPPTGR